MKTLSKPTRLPRRLWVFSSLVAAALTSCQSSPPPARPFSQPSLLKVKPSPPPTPNGGFEGLSLEAAKAKAEQAKLRWRVTRIDGKSRPVTKDYRPQRLNFEITQGKVSRVTKG